MRILLFTGKGGVGKTSIAAATAVRAAHAGRRTLVMSTDPAHSLGDVLGAELGPEPAEVAPNLHAEQLDAQQRLEDSWRDIQSYVVSLLQWGGLGQLEAEELSVVPGLEEIFSLIDVRRHVGEDRWDVLVVDCAPTAETLRLLSLPDALGWYIERAFPLERVSLAHLIRPMLGRVSSVPMPEEPMLAAADRLYRSLIDVRDILKRRDVTSVRLVLNPERVVLAEARRTYTYLCLFGYAVDAIMVNRLLPGTVTDPHFARWKTLQADHLAAIRAAFDGLPVLTAPLFDDELIGVDRLAELADVLYGDVAAEAVLVESEPLRFTARSDGYELALALPFVGKGDVDLFRRADELFVKVGSYNRSLVLPAALRRCDVISASMEQGWLTLRFSPPAGAERAAGV